MTITSDQRSEQSEAIRLLERRVARERRAREEAERLLERKSLELYAANQALLALNGELEKRVRERTLQLQLERECAVEVAGRDPLTGLASRAHYLARLQTLLHPTGWRHASIGLLFIDMDNFKVVNDTLGHDAGDELLKAFAERLVKVSPGDALIARPGGDEFAVVIEGEQDYGAVAKRILDALIPVFQICGRPINIAASIGIATYPRDAASLGELQRFADIALYAAKTAGRNQWRRFDTAMHRQIVERQKLRNDLGLALTKHAVKPWYQPRVSLSTMGVNGVEALARWLDTDRGYVAPTEFIDVAEECGLILSLGETILRQACADCARWQGDGPVRRVSVNVSPRQLRTGQFAETVAAILGETNCPGDKLELEITESLLLWDLDFARAELKRVADLGVSIVLDDFGTGYSNLTYLRALPISGIKIDKSFVKDVTLDANSGSIIRAIIGLAHSLGLRTTAEGVETTLQLDVLKSYGCDEAQGFVFAPALPRGDLESFLARQPNFA